MNKNIFFRNIPKVDMLMELDEIKKLEEKYTRELVLDAIRKKTYELREYIGNNENEKEIEDKIKNLINDVVSDVEKTTKLNMKRVINGTGTILHTNLGRAVISEESAERVKNLVIGYSNLEYDLEAGQRGSRYSHFEKIITKITGAESAMAVNNNAAAVLLILSTFAKNKEVIVSRGELVEIGGSFRVPDVMTQSGGTLIEVGTTNKTHPFDYENAINENTAALLKVHTSNYRIVGFTESVTIQELVEIGKARNVPVIEDLGSGVLIDLSKYGITYEPTVQSSVNAGADIVCFSGDKLLGGPQAGIIIGKKEMIDKIKKNPLTRALRIDKFTAIALECAFHEYIDEEKAIKNVPVLKMITRPLDEINEQARNLCDELKSIMGADCDIDVENCESQIGGGSLPLERINSKAVCLRHHSISTASIEKKLRHCSFPVIVRAVNDKVLMDMRTVTCAESKIIADMFREILR